MSHEEQATAAISRGGRRDPREENLHGEALVEFRRTHAKPILEKLEKYLREQCSKVLPKSLTGEAIQ